MKQGWFWCMFCGTGIPQGSILSLQLNSKVPQRWLLCCLIWHLIHRTHGFWSDESSLFLPVSLLFHRMIYLIHLYLLLQQGQLDTGGWCIMPTSFSSPIYNVCIPNCTFTTFCTSYSISPTHTFCIYYTLQHHYALCFIDIVHKINRSTVRVRYFAHRWAFYRALSIWVYVDLYGFETLFLPTCLHFYRTVF